MPEKTSVVHKEQSPDQVGSDDTFGTKTTTISDHQDKMEKTAHGNSGGNVTIYINKAGNMSPVNTTGANLYKIAGNPRQLKAEDGTIIQNNETPVAVTHGESFTAGPFEDKFAK